MRHKWMVIMVVMVTTLTTAQEALKQYEGLKAQAAAWATSGLWTGFLNSYEQPSETLRAQSNTCSVIQPGEESQQSYHPALAQTIRMESVKAHRQEQSARALHPELLPLEDNQHDDHVEAVEQALESAGEVARLADTGEPEGAGEPGAQAADAIRALPGRQDEDEVNLAGHTLRALRLVSFAPGRAATDASPLNAAADPEAALRQPRAAAPRVQAQKVRAMKKALRLLQLQLDRAARQELSRAEIETELPDELIMALIAADSDDQSIALNLPSAPPQPAALPATMTSVGGCAGE
jgi:hypothetical protein